MAAHHPDFSKLAARIAIDNLHKNTSSDFAEVIEKLYRYTDAQGRAAPLVHADVYAFVVKYKDEINKALVYDRDFDYDYFAFKTLERYACIYSIIFYLFIYICLFIFIYIYLFNYIVVLFVCLFYKGAFSGFLLSLFFNYYFLLFFFCLFFNIFLLV